MATITLGRTGLRVEQNGFGALPIQRISKSEAVRLLRRAQEGGMIYFDTARAYTDSEEKLAMVINLPTVANRKNTDSFPVRRKAIERGISVMTCMDTAWAFLKAIRLKQNDTKLEYKALD